MTNDMLVMNENGQWDGRIRPLTSLQRKQLLADLNPNRVSKRTANGKSGGKVMSYVEAWDVRATLTRIFGFGGWSGEVLNAQMIDSGKNGRGNPTVAMMVTYRLTIHQLGCIYTETAVSGQSGSDFGAAAEFAVKTAESDALKRCAINLGTAFGLSLYNDGQLADVVKQIQAPHQNARALRRQVVAEAKELEALVALEAGDAVELAADETPAEPDRVVGTDVDFDPDPDAPPAPGAQAAPQRAPRGRASAPKQQPADEQPADVPAVLDEQLDVPPSDDTLRTIQGGFGGQQS